MAYLWDGDVVTEEAPLRLDGSVDWDAGTVWHYEQRSFVPLAKEGSDDSLTYIATDHLGTPREMFGEGGNLVWAAEYRTWGAMRRLWVSQADNDNTVQIYHQRSVNSGRLYDGITISFKSFQISNILQFCPIGSQGQRRDVENGCITTDFDTLTIQQEVS